MESHLAGLESDDETRAGLARAAIAAKGPEPEIGFTEQFYLRAFEALKTTRQYGMTVGPIPWTAIDAYATRKGITGDSFRTFERMIRAIDNTWLKHPRNQPKPDK